MCLELLWFFLDTGPTTNLPLTYLNLMVRFTKAILSPVTQSARYTTLAIRSVWSQNFPHTQCSAT
jgi:hypothetical protein